MTLGALASLVSACAADPVPDLPMTEVPISDLPAETEPVAGELFPDVVDATATDNGDGTWTFSATLSSPYDTAQRYADAWRILDEDGTELGIRILGHDHQNEQPFTRTLAGVEIPEGTTTVTVQGRDQISGWGGETATLSISRRG